MAPESRALLQLVDSRLDMPAPGGLTTADLALYPSILCQLCLPVAEVKDEHGKPKNEYIATSGRIQMKIVADSTFGVPYGLYARLIVAFLSREAHRTRERLIDLGPSLETFITTATRAKSASGGIRGVRTLFNDQLLALASSRINYLQPSSESSPIGGIGQYAFSRRYGQSQLWGPQLVGQEKFERKMLLDEEFFEDILVHGVPLRADVLRALGSPLCIDIYAWLTYRANQLEGQSLTLKWSDVQEQFGSGYKKNSGSFRRNFKNSFSLVREVYDPSDRDCVTLETVGDKVIITAKRPSVPTELSAPALRPKPKAAKPKILDGQESLF